MRRLIGILLLLPAGLAAQTLPENASSENLALLGQTINWGGLVSSVVLILLAWLLLKFVDQTVENLGRRFSDSRLLFQRIKVFFRYFVYIAVAINVVLLSFEFSPQVLALLSGGIFVAIGFATRDLLASLVAGIMIVIDRPFQVGDRVSFGGQYGDVIQIGLRSVKLRTLDDSVVTIPNNLFLSEVSSSANFGVLDMQIETDFYIGIDQDAKLASQLVRESAVISRYIHLPKPLSVIVEQVLMESGVALRIRLKAYVLDTVFEKQFVTDVTLRVQDAFAEHDILPPHLFNKSLST